MIEQVSKFICDNCGKIAIEDKPFMPDEWLFHILSRNVVTGYGQNVVDTKRLHFCSKECKEEYLLGKS